MPQGYDLVCLSHLRWGFVHQRPNHLMARCAKERRVFFVEEPVYDADDARLDVHEAVPNLFVCTPHLREGTAPEAAEVAQRSMLRALARERNLARAVLWFYTPMALPIVEGLGASGVVYDCMDDLTGSHGAPPELVERERRLFACADLVFTGGQSLCEARRLQHPAVHAFPSSVDARHFTRARGALEEPPDQRDLYHPRVGFFGVIDERLDLDLLGRLADDRPDYRFVMIGPVVMIDPATLPRRPNLHYLGGKGYDELPAYLAGWDAAMMPFALNAATRFTSPTKTLEYLAAGRPVVSTAIHDVVYPYGEIGLVRIADAGSFAAAVDGALATDPHAHHAACNAVLARTSWDRTWRVMSRLVEVTLFPSPSVEPLGERKAPAGVFDLV